MKESDCELTIRSGVLSIESIAWAGMLSRMYVRWLKVYNHKSNMRQMSNGTYVLVVNNEEVRIRLRTEVGMHRLVCVSPFDPEDRRHTSFAEVRMADYHREDRVVRSYVFEPYQLVKDTRTGIESTDVQSVLDGDIDQFINAQDIAVATIIRKQATLLPAESLELTLNSKRGWDISTAEGDVIGEVHKSDAVGCHFANAFAESPVKLAENQQLKDQLEETIQAGNKARKNLAVIIETVEDVLVPIQCEGHWINTATRKLRAVLTKIKGGTKT